MNYRPDDGQPLQREENQTIDQVRRFGPAAVIALVALIFVLQNTEDAEFEFLTWDFTLPLWIVLVLAMLVGAVIFWGWSWRRRRRRAREQTDD